MARLAVEASAAGARAVAARAVAALAAVVTAAVASLEAMLEAVVPMAVCSL